MDELLVRMATQSLAKDQLANDIADRVQQAVRVKPRVEFTNVIDIYDPANQTKARRFVDKR
jgi:phenylacetate-coenzyme A ligase PaaK-like adenylate-forming protein